jgi:hypothetical protein
VILQKKVVGVAGDVDCRQDVLGGIARLGELCDACVAQKDTKEKRPGVSVDLVRSSVRGAMARLE